MNLKPATPAQVRAVQLAVGHLRRARDLLAEAEAANSLERVRSALKSAEGAQRHVQRRARATAAPVLTDAIPVGHATVLA